MTTRFKPIAGSETESPESKTGDSGSVFAFLGKIPDYNQPISRCTI